VAPDYRKRAIVGDPGVGGAMMIAIRLTLLGGFEARLSAGETINLPTKKAQALLAYLGLQPGHAHQRDKLAALLWGETNEQHARDGFRHALVTLRKSLGGVRPEAVHVEGQTLALNPAAVEVDVATFQQRVAAGTPGALEQAAELYRGDLLFGFTVSEPLFEAWLVAERERLREMALEALARLLSHHAETGRTERAIQTAIRLLGLDPLQEAVHRTLMRLYARQGRRGAALKQYQVCVALLHRELGADPEPETKRLYQELLSRSAETVTAADQRRDGRSRQRAGPRLLRTDFLSSETPPLPFDAESARLSVRRCRRCRGFIDREEPIVVAVVEVPAERSHAEQSLARLDRTIGRWHFPCAPKLLRRYAVAIYGAIEKRILAVVALAAITAFLPINIPNDDIDSIEDLMHPEIMERLT
jgi:DNA-binding SARP family transcriptional activator